MISDLIDAIKENQNISCILDDYKTNSEKGFVVEKIWDIIIKFGFCDIFPNNEFKHIIGNTNNGKPKFLVSLKKYITGTKIISGNSNGYSDITLYNVKEDKYIFISCKYFSKKEDNIDKYDIQKIITMISDNKEIYKNFEIYLIVNNKENILDKVKKSHKTSNPITKYIIEDHVLDFNNFEKYYKLFRESIMQTKLKDYDELYGFGKTHLDKRFHQELIVLKTMNLIDENNKQILWGCKCRSGKTYISGKLIVELKKDRKKFSVLIITPAPNETIPQFIDELFIRFREFNDCQIIHLNKKDIKISDKNIIIASKQFLQKHDKLDLPKINLIIFDENHFGGTTDISKNIIGKYSDKETVKIYLTATYYKPLKEWNIAENCQIYWDIEDEQFCKKQDIKSLKEKHGSEVDIIVKNFTKLKLSIFDSYRNYPDLHLITNLFDHDRYQIIKKDIMDSKYGFSFEVLFALNKNKKSFEFNKQVMQVLRYISGSKKEIDFKNGDKSIFGRIDKICSETESRNCLTQLWFLPTQNINEISICLKQCMLEDTILSKYEIMVVNSKIEKFQDLKDEITKTENIAKEKHKLGVIILAGNMLTLGITLLNCDIVFLLNNTLSSDKIVQMMYRSMSESNKGDKKFGFVVDLNISRVIYTCITYNIHKNDMNIEDKLKYLIENNLINIDVDYFINKQTNSDKIVKKILDIWKEDPINNLKNMLSNIENEVIKLDLIDQKVVNEYFTSSNKIHKLKIEFNEEDNQKLPSGKEKTKIESDSDSDSDTKHDKKIQEISFTKDVLPFIIPLSCILTIRDNNKDFMKMLDQIKNNNELLDIFNDQTFIWWNSDNIIDIVSNLVSKYIEKNSLAYNISINFKMSLQSLIDEPNKLLELINNSLKPKQEEKKKFGEVFTPINIINEMLDKLDEHYKKTHKTSIFEESKLKWFDPANGLGNFPIVIYLRLMNGLKKYIKNDNSRKKHILENMLYMCELNKKNVFVCKQIFDINNEYKLNLHLGDSLQLNTKKVWNISEFDIIIGNPPYNKELTKSGANPLYNEFIERYIDRCKYLTFIVPSRWFAGGKGLDKFRKMMLKRTDIAYIKHFDNASQIFGNSVDIKGGVNYFLMDKKYDGLCKFNDSKIDFKKYDILTDSKYYNIIDKLSKYKSITNIYLGRYFGIESNDSKLVDQMNEKYIKCYVSQQKGFIKYIDSNILCKEYNFYKIITTESSFKGGSCFGNLFIGEPNEVHTGSYISFKSKNKKEAESLLSYLKCKLPNFMLSLRKISQHVNENTCKWIPLVPLDRKWNNNEVYKYFKLTNDEIKLISNTKIIGYNDINL